MTRYREAAVVQDLASLRAQVARWRMEGERVALVPTMGALHEGHMELVREGQRRADRVVLSIFVNPTQFAPSEDFTSYPRSLEADCARFDAAGGDLVYAPAVDQIYPVGFATTLSLAGPAIVGLEDRFRPTHFAGVATVVAKLLLQVSPDVALFGEKDYQQLCVVARMARDLDLPVAVIGVPTVRDRDGLALSSRNAYLSAQQRAVAPRVHALLQDCAAAIRDGRPVARSVAEAAAALAAAGFRVDYFEARDGASLLPMRGGSPLGTPAGGGPSRAHAPSRQCGDRGSGGIAWVRTSGRWRCA